MVRSAAIAAAAAGVLLAGCGGAAPASSPPGVPQDAVGGYTLTTVITDSTLPDNPAGPSSTVSTEAYLSCADDPCTALLQRSARTDRPQGNTTRLDPVPGGFRGEHIRIGECGGSSHGTYGEAFTWTWTRAADGVLSGTLEQVFTGCGLDGSTTFTATATPQQDLTLPYLPADQQRRLIAALNAYDVNVSAVYVSGAQCDTEAGATTGEEAGCFSATFAGWVQDVEDLGRRVRAVAPHASGACRDAVEAFDFDSWGSVVEKAAVRYAQATRPEATPAAMTAALQTEEAATRVATGEHAHLIAAAAMCTDPRRAAELGATGVLGLDHGSVLPPLADVS